MKNMRLTALTIIAASAFVGMIFTADAMYKRAKEKELPPCREGHWNYEDKWVCDAREPPPGMKISDPEKRIRPPYRGRR